MRSPDKSLSALLLAPLRGHVNPERRQTNLYNSLFRVWGNSLFSPFDSTQMVLVNGASDSNSGLLAATGISTGNLNGQSYFACKFPLTFEACSTDHDIYNSGCSCAYFVGLLCQYAR